MFIQRSFIILIIAAFGAAIPNDPKNTPPKTQQNWGQQLYSGVCKYYMTDYNYPQKSWQSSEANPRDHRAVVTVIVSDEKHDNCYRCAGIVIGSRAVLVHNCGAGPSHIGTTPYHYTVFAGKRDVGTETHLYGVLKLEDVSFIGTGQSKRLFQVAVMKDPILSEEVGCVPLSSLMEHDLSNVTEVTLLYWCRNKQDHSDTLREMIVKRECGELDEKDHLPLGVPKGPDYTPHQSCIVVDDTPGEVNRDLQCMRSYGPVLTYKKNDQRYYMILRDDRMVTQHPVIEEFPFTYYKLSYDFYNKLKKQLGAYDLCELDAFPFKYTKKSKP